MSRRARNVSLMRSSRWLRYITAERRWPSVRPIVRYTLRHQSGGGDSIEGSPPPGSIFRALQRESTVVKFHSGKMVGRLEKSLGLLIDRRRSLSTTCLKVTTKAWHLFR
jgi:hypothetical protein